MCVPNLHRHEQDATQSPFLSGVELIWKQFSFSWTGCRTQAKESNLLNDNNNNNNNNKFLSNF